jgi:putative spermidine/putrescine transport system ATP-binding protein
MTTNTARDAAAADGTRQAGQTGGTSVSLQNLSRSFGTTRALDGLSLEIAPGELVALLGPSGCGKTTALRIVAGFESADTGSVLVDGKDISSVAAARRDMGMVFQSYSLFPNMNTLDNVAFGLRMRKQGSAQRRKRAGELLEMVGLVDQAQQYPHQLSGGQQQRVALARALAIEPRVLLLDEPLSALDAKVRLQLREQIRTLQQRLGTTTLFVTHDQEEALSMSDRVVVMNDGAIEQVGTPSEIYNAPVSRFVASFVGTLNLLNGRIVDASSGAIDIDGQRATTARKLNGAKPGDILPMALRPEALRIGVGGDDRNTLAGVIEDVAFLGAVVRVRVRLAEAAVIIDTFNTGANDLPALGAPITVNFGRDDLIPLLAH